MLALQGYYDGKTIQPLEKISAKKNQRLIITILDEFINDVPEEKKQRTAKGSLAKYANPELWNQEKTAWEKAVTERYGNNTAEPEVLRVGIKTFVKHNLDFPDCILYAYNRVKGYEIKAFDKKLIKLLEQGE